MNTAFAIVLILAWVGVATYGDTLFKRSPSLTSATFWRGVAVYALTSFFAFWTFRLQQWGWIILLWNSASLAVSLLLSVTMFGEAFTIRRRVSAVLILAAMLLTE